MTKQGNGENQDSSSCKTGPGIRRAAGVGPGGLNGIMTRPASEGGPAESKNVGRISRGMIWEEEREARRRETIRWLQTPKMFGYSQEAAQGRRSASEQKYCSLPPRVDQYGSRKSSTNPSGLRRACRRDSPLLPGGRASRDDDSRESGIDLRCSRHR